MLLKWIPFWHCCLQSSVRLYWLTLLTRGSVLWSLNFDTTYPVWRLSFSVIQSLHVVQAVSTSWIHINEPRFLNLFIELLLPFPPSILSSSALADPSMSPSLVNKGWKGEKKRSDEFGKGRMEGETDGMKSVWLWPGAKILLSHIPTNPSRRLGSLPHHSVDPRGSLCTPFLAPLHPRKSLTKGVSLPHTISPHVYIY